jgi:hypothetical protein
MRFKLYLNIQCPALSLHVVEEVPRVIEVMEEVTQQHHGLEEVGALITMTISRCRH